MPSDKDSTLSYEQLQTLLDLGSLERLLLFDKEGAVLLDMGKCKQLSLPPFLDPASVHELFTYLQAFSQHHEEYRVKDECFRWLMNIKGGELLAIQQNITIEKEQSLVLSRLQQQGSHLQQM